MPQRGRRSIGILVALTGSGILNATATKITSSNNPSKLGQSVTFTATVTAATGTTPPTGNVVFSDGATVLGTVALAGNGKASLTTSALTSGSHSVTAAYAGDSGHGASSASLTQTVQRLKMLDVAPLLGQHVDGGRGRDLHRDGERPRRHSDRKCDIQRRLDRPGHRSPASGGRASITTAALARGPHEITAAYSGDGTYAPSRTTSISTYAATTAVPR